MRASTRDHNRGGHKIQVALNQVAPDFRTAQQRTRYRLIAPFRTSVAKVAQKLRPRVLSRPKEDGVGMPRSLVGQRGDVQAAESDKCALAPIVIRNRVRAIG